MDRNGFNGFSAFGVLSGIILLESEIIDLAATPVNNNHIRVDWSVDKEVDVDHYIIERSTDDATFTPIATHPSAGNSVLPRDYSINDNAVLPNINYYYRVKTMNLDGTSQYTHSVVAALTKDGNVETVNVFPNPLTHGNAVIEITSTIDKSSTIMVYDAIGQEIMSRKINVQQGLNTYTLPTQDWAGGVYYIHINSAQSSTVKELIKTK